MLVLTLGQRIQDLSQPEELCQPTLFALTADAIYEFCIDFAAWEYREEFESMGAASFGDDSDISGGDAPPELKIPVNYSSEGAGSWSQNPYNVTFEGKVSSFSGIHFTVGEDPILIIEQGDSEFAIRFFDDAARQQWRACLAYALVAKTQTSDARSSKNNAKIWARAWESWSFFKLFWKFSPQSTSEIESRF